MARLLAFALEHGIEPEYARSIIRKRNLVPESPEVENWPWPVMVYTLGRFVVVLDGGRTSLAGTAQGRPVELLQALIAAGGREVHSTALIDQLWPDADDGRKTLEINLHRLRKLLGCDQACILHEGKLTLDPRHCWVDTWAFERACNQISENADSEMKLEGVAEQVLRLYQGQFLANEAEQPWMLATRERLRSRFLRCVQQLAQHWESAGRWDKAATLYERGLEADNLAEELYRRLMLCHRACGCRAEALEVYRRCRHTLSVVLGIEPSSATQAVYRSLLES
jgi:DNA-binding SARP family transcriptional activator